MHQGTQLPTWGTRIPHPPSGVVDLSAAYLTHESCDLLSGFYGQRCCDKSNRQRDVIERPPALPWDSLQCLQQQLFGTMGNTNSGNLVRAAAGSPSSELSRSRESTPPPGHALVSQSVRGTRGAARAHTAPPNHPETRRPRGVRPAPGARKARQGKASGFGAPPPSGFGAPYLSASEVGRS
jgi:hypothetical protein